MSKPVLYLVVCGAGPAKSVAAMVDLALPEWDVWCLATPSAVEHFLDLDDLERRTGHPVRTTHQGPRQQALPQADAVVVAPATYNTINKWAAGIADTYVLIQLAELTGLGVPIVAMPYVNSALAGNRVFHRSVAELRESGVTVLLNEPHAPRTPADYPWAAALGACLPRKSSTEGTTPR
ncbi:flavoprotein [Actinokineospora terrae]|uniref:Flavoprotein n=1 Tax=Actinokineospora terrae TaxID=155974 RepID=A0A1H9R227_9PSEU|nr:flavoprotein [Actinokineospora terrae]SER66575.1 Flavoprotein [Actinokineospora terrae]